MNNNGNNQNYNQVNNKVIIGYDDSPKNQYVMEEKPSREDMQKSIIAFSILLIGFFLGKLEIVCSVLALIITFLVKKSSVLNIVIRFSSIVIIVIYLINMFK